MLGNRAEAVASYADALKNGGSASSSTDRVRADRPGLGRRAPQDPLPVDAVTAGEHRMSPVGADR
ncbi:MAG: hypothetical protein MZV63_63260 [Marinilabiliales bacterium]|nr:hypothetical protein [Marinilabiliales bacterium]